MALLAVLSLLGCSSEPLEESVSHPSSMIGATWLRSDYDIVGRESKEYSDHSGQYVVLTIRHGDKLITAKCAATWVTDTGEDLPSTSVMHDNCSDLPMGLVKLERTDWSGLYYFTGTGKHRKEIALSVTKIEIKR